MEDRNELIDCATIDTGYDPLTFPVENLDEILTTIRACIQDGDWMDDAVEDSRPAITIKFERMSRGEFSRLPEYQ